jgi:hypothetical protein
VAHVEPLKLKKEVTMKILMSFILCTTMLAPAFADEITPIAEIQRGTRVLIKGTVVSIPDEDEFVLRDETGSVLVYLGRPFFDVNVGDSEITVRGFVDDDWIKEVYASQIIFPDGQVINL